MPLKWSHIRGLGCSCMCGAGAASLADTGLWHGRLAREIVDKMPAIQTLAPVLVFDAGFIR